MPGITPLKSPHFLGVSGRFSRRRAKANAIYLRNNCASEGKNDPQSPAHAAGAPEETLKARAMILATKQNDQQVQGRIAVNRLLYPALASAQRLEQALGNEADQQPPMAGLIESGTRRARIVPLSLRLANGDMKVCARSALRHAGTGRTAGVQPGRLTNTARPEGTRSACWRDR